MNYKIVIDGKGGSGKDQFVEFCKKYNNKVYNISTIDKIKEHAINLGWNGVKDNKGRLLLSELKRISKEYNELPLRDVLNKIYYICQDSSDNIIFIHSREQEEIKQIKNKFKDDNSCYTLLIENNRVNSCLGNNSDDCDKSSRFYDYVIHNDWGLEELEVAACSFIEGIVK